MSAIAAICRPQAWVSKIQATGQTPLYDAVVWAWSFWRRIATRIAGPC